MSLSELRNAIDKACLNGRLVTEIRIRPATHEALKKTLEQTSQTEIRQIASLFGIPVKIDSEIPNKKKFWIVTRAIDVGEVTQK